MATTLVYADVFAGENAAVDALLLWSVARVWGERAPFWRTALGGALGGTYALATLFPALLPLAGLLGKALTPAAMVAVAFGGGPAYWRRLATFFAASFGAAGCALGLGALFTAPGESASPYLLPCCGVLAVVAVAEAGRALLRKRRQAQGVAELVLEVAGGQLHLTALVDSGLRLMDPFSRRPVVVVEKGALAGLVPPEVLTAIASGDPEELARAVERHPAWAHRLRPLPYISVGRHDGLLWGFRPDRVLVGQAAWETAAAQVVVGVAPHGLSPGGEFAAIIPTELLAWRHEGGAA